MSISSIQNNNENYKEFFSEINSAKRMNTELKENVIYQ
jgi:hypothetical protein